ncbi:MAG: helix-turn-helix domain-containing protein [Flavitalea sp.]
MSNHVAVKSVQHHTIRELLNLSGEKHQGEGLHIFDKDYISREMKIDYPFRSDHFSVFLITGGEFTISLNLFDYRLVKDDLLVIGPNAIRQFIDNCATCSFSAIVFTADFLAQTGIHKKHIEPFDFFAAHGHPHMRLNAEEVVALTDSMKILLERNSTRSNSPYGLEIVQHHFIAFLYELSALHRKYHAGMKVKLTRKEDLTMRFLKLLPQHFKEERSVQFYAELLYVTPKYLTQTVKEYTGKTAGVFIDEMVIMEAKVLLSDHSYSVAQVAESLFFSDQFFFSKFFKNHAGVTPTDYRKTF